MFRWNAVVLFYDFYASNPNITYDACQHQCDATGSRRVEGQKSEPCHWRLSTQKEALNHIVERDNSQINYWKSCQNLSALPTSYSELAVPLQSYSTTSHTLYRRTSCTTTVTRASCDGWSRCCNRASLHVPYSALVVYSDQGELVGASQCARRTKAKRPVTAMTLTGRSS